MASNASGSRGSPSHATASEESHYSDDFEHDASASAAASRSSPVHRPPKTGVNPAALDEDHYSETFDDYTAEASGTRRAGGSQSGSETSPDAKSRSLEASHQRGRSTSRNGSGSRRSSSQRRQSSQEPGSRSGSPSPVAARGKVMDISELFAAKSHSELPQAAKPLSELPKVAASSKSGDSGKSAGYSGSAGSTDERPSVSKPSAAVHSASERLEREADISQLPTSSAFWRAPDILEPRSRSAGSVPAPLSPPGTVPRTHDAVPRHLKPHAWDIASLGQEPVPPKEAMQTRAQPPLGRGLQPVAGGPQGFGGARGPLLPGAEAQLVERLACRFVLDRKAPTLEKKERAAYKEMLQQVSFTALEPSVAQEAALLISKRWLAPVSSTEALRAFRRCLHTILCDDRVLDIVEHQMTLHFGRMATAAK
mmetsp:Transcript_58346/g.103701  ORF Transcript_58346/g.103701 Transcript_58346/m.103701 type:complete len:424 (-) Transcript_58346:32-1303(-)